MTEDPLKLFVVVMAILVCVVVVVAYSSYDRANDFQTALDRSHTDAKTIRELSTKVSAICRRIKTGQLEGGYLTFIGSQMRRHGIGYTSFGKQKSAKNVGPRLQEHRYFIEFYRGKKSQPLRRDQIAAFCRDVERKSQGLLKTIEIELTRSTAGPGASRASVRPAWR